MTEIASEGGEYNHAKEEWARGVRLLKLKAQTIAAESHHLENLSIISAIEIVPDDGPVPNSEKNQMSLTGFIKYFNIPKDIVEECFHGSFHSENSDEKPDTAPANESGL